jgi:hypothetical protein
VAGIIGPGPVPVGEAGPHRARAVLARAGRPLAGARLEALAWLAFATYLFTPTSLPLVLDGIPINARPEFLGLVVLGMAAWVAATAWLLGLSAAPAPPPPPGARWRRLVCLTPLLGATVVLFGLSGVKLAFPRSDAIPLCLRSPEIGAPGCLWSPEGRGTPRVTRYENRLSFDEAAGRSWRLGYLNSSPEFNLYGHPDETPIGRRQRFRSQRANPFEAFAELSPQLAGLLSRRFADDQGVVTFSGRLRGVLEVTSADGARRFASAPGQLGELRAFRVAVPRGAIEGLGWVYRNYDCPDGPLEACTATMTFRTVPHSRAILEVQVVQPGTLNTVALGYGPAAWASRQVPAVLARWLEAVALACFAWGAVGGPIARAVARTISPVARGLGVLEGILVPGAALGLSTLAYGRAVATLVSAQRYATLFDSAVSFWLTLPGTAALLLAATRTRWRARLRPVAAGPSSRAGLLLWLLPFCAYALLQAARLAPRTDEATLWWPGDDNLTWASRGKDVLREGTLAWAFASIAKLAFPYLRAAGYVVLGEGERFTSIAIGIAFLLVYAIAAHCVFQTCLAAIERGGAALRAGTVVLYGMITLWLANALLAYGATWAVNLFTEGPAWIAFTLSVALLLKATGGHLDGRAVAAVGGTFAAAILFRSTLVVFIPLFVVVLLTSESAGPRALGTVVRGILVPVTAAAALMAAHATIVGAWSHVVWYLSTNTNLRPGMSLASAFGAPPQQLVPTREAGVQLTLFATLFLLTLGRERRRGGRWTVGPVLRLVAFGFAVFLFGFLLQMPMLPAPYYPRTIMPTYFFLIVFLAMWADRWSRRRDA